MCYNRCVTIDVLCISTDVSCVKGTKYLLIHCVLCLMPIISQNCRLSTT